MNKPCLTVLMPAYNAEKFLGEAIESILNQTLINFEFLIIDDASTDSSGEVINSYTDSRIRLVKNEENLGISATLNKGIEMASTELIARMDADDISYPARLQKQYDFFLAHPDCALLSTWAREITENKEPILIEKWASNSYYYNLIFECRIYHPTVMYKRSAVIDVGKYSTPYCEDYDLWWKISRKYKINNLQEVLLDYRSTDESLSRVTKKIEYENAQSEQVLRNIHYYTGNDFQLSRNEVECLRYNVAPLLKENNLKAIIKCLHKLDYIDRCILEKDNVNPNREAIKEAARRKRELIILFLQQNFSKSKIVMLLMRTGYWQILKALITNFILKKIGFIRRVLLIFFK